MTLENQHKWFQRPEKSEMKGENFKMFENILTAAQLLTEADSRLTAPVRELLRTTLSGLNTHDCMSEILDSSHSSIYMSNIEGQKPSLEEKMRKYIAMKIARGVYQGSEDAAQKELILQLMSVIEKPVGQKS